MAYSGPNPRVSSTVFLDQLAASVDNPPTGYVKALIRYGRMLLRSSGGVEVPLGSSGGGLKNYVKNPNDAFANWTASGAGIAVATETTASNFPDGATQASALRITRASGSDYAYTRFTVDASDYGKLSSILASYKYAGTAGDYTIELYTNTASNYSGSYVQVPLSGMSSIPSNSVGGTLMANGMTGVSGTQYMELRIKGNAGTTALYLNAVTFTPGFISQTYAAGYLGRDTSLTTTGFGTIATVEVDYYRRGNNLYAIGKFTSGTSTAVAALITLRDGMAADMGSITKIIGKWWRNNSTGSTRKSGTLFITNGNTNINFGSDDSVTAASPDGALNGNAVISSGENLYFEFEVATGLFAGGNLNIGIGAQEEYYGSTSGTWDAASTAGQTSKGPVGSPISGSLTGNRAKVIRLDTPLQAGERLQLQYQIPSNGGWVDSEQSSQPIINWPSAGFGGYISAATIGSTDITVSFLQFASPGATYNSTSGATNYSASVYSAWRVVRYRSSSPVGFGKPSATDWGISPPQSAETDITVTSTAAGWVTIRAKGIYYQDTSGNHRCRFNIVGTITSKTLVQSDTVTLGGTVFKSVTNFEQAVTAINNGSKPWTGAWATPGNGVVGLFADSSTGVTKISISADLELDAKPSWAA